MNRRSSSTRWAFAAATVALLASADIGAQAKFYGEHEFRTSCAACHGVDASGNGQMASQLTPKPANLTVLSKNNGGVFPYERVFQMIDGRGALAAHGTGQMPIWGDRYSLEVKQPIVRARILELVYHLRGIQTD
jgi:mono/diheme cytochrome c family protein